MGKFSPVHVPPWALWPEKKKERMEANSAKKVIFWFTNPYVLTHTSVVPQLNDN